MNAASVAWGQISLSTKMACGVRRPFTASGGNELAFRVGGKPAHYIRVLYVEGMDLYTVEHFRLRRGNKEKILLEQAEGVYAEDLSGTIYAMVNK